jgi:hypothetical protein
MKEEPRRNRSLPETDANQTELKSRTITASRDEGSDEDW